MSIIPASPEAFRLMMEGSQALSDVENNGMRIDTDYLDRKIEWAGNKIRDYETRLREDDVFRVWRKRYGTNADIGSPQQLASVLFEDLGYEVKNWTSEDEKKRKPKMDEVTLEGIDLPFVQMWIARKKMIKARSTYLIGIRRETHNGFLHPVFNLHFVTTYRSSSDSPNFQNIPVRDPAYAKLIRRAFIPYNDESMLMEIDYGALEFRGAACVVGDTLIETIDGPTPIRDVCRRVSEGEEVHVYGYDSKAGRIAVSPVLEGGMTKRSAEVFKVTLDNGESVTATADHKFMMRDGTYRKLSDLQPGCRLMPLYIRNHKSPWGTIYQDVMLNNGHKMKAHNLIVLDVFGVEIKGSKLLVHHVDGNGTHNNLSNLRVMTRKRHMQIHATQGWRDNENGRKEENCRRSRSEEFRQKMREMNKRRREEWTEEQWRQWRLAISKARKANGSAKGDKNPMYGRTHSATAKVKMRKKKIGYIPETAGWNKGLTKDNNDSIRAASEKNKGREPPNKGNIKPPVVVECQWCGEEFEVQWMGPSRVRRFCSGSCSAFHREEMKRCKNHMVVSIEPAGVEDVYNITVEDIHNYATSAGVIIKNCFWKDPAMIAYASDPSLDIHRDMAAECYILPTDRVSKPVRGTAKTYFVFPELYGSYYGNIGRRLWERITLDDLKTADGTPVGDHLASKGIHKLGTKSAMTDSTFLYHIKQVEREFNERFPHWAKAKEQWWADYLKNGWFPLMTGFVCQGIYSINDVMNYPIQGPSFHLTLWSLIQLNKRLKQKKMRSRVIGQIHDSIMGNVYRNERDDYIEMATSIMTREVKRHWDWVVTPLEIEIEASDTNWFEKKSLAL